MIRKLRNHPFIAAFLGLVLILFLFILYIYNSSSRGGVSALASGKKVAVVEVDGVLLESKEIVEEIRSAYDDDDVKGVVIRINSPGGGVAPSQEIYGEINRLKGKKKVVASFSSVAASGGYYIASAAEKIVSNPGTLTGSIGVIMDFSNIEGLFEKIGLKSFVVKSGRYKDIGSPTRDMTADEKDLLQDVIDDVHNQFITAIVEGRGMEREKVEKIADGRIFSGAQALQMGLVDELGSLQDSIKIVADMAGIEGEPKVIYTKKEKGFFDYLMESSASVFLDRLKLPQFMFVASYP